MQFLQLTKGIIPECITMSKKLKSVCNEHWTGVAKSAGPWKYTV